MEFHSVTLIVDSSLKPVPLSSLPSHGAVGASCWMDVPATNMLSQRLVKRALPFADKFQDCSGCFVRLNLLSCQVTERVNHTLDATKMSIGVGEHDQEIHLNI